MKKRFLSPILAASTAFMMLAGAGGATLVMASEAGEEESEETEEAGETLEAEEAEAAEDDVEGDDLEALQYMGPGPVVMDDQMAANYVADLIDQIYVQEWTEDTWEQCEEARAAWDSLSRAAKEMVIGDEADPDYFGRDTGDASLDNPRNQDDIGENELLVVSFGTSFNNSRAMDIGGIEETLAEAYPDYSVRRAFTAQIIINHVYARNAEKMDNMEQALQRAVDNGVKNLVVQPTHLMHGAEYDEMMEAIEEYADQFETVRVAEPLLGEVGDTEDSVNEDKERVAEAVVAAAVESSDYDSREEMDEDGTALVLMGHGTSHSAKITYSQMQAQMQDLGYDNVFIGTVEGEPEETSCGNVADAVYEAGYTNVILRPLMVVAGDHANNDMAGEDADSWYNVFLATGYFDNIDCQIEGMGRIPAIEEIYVEHTQAAIDGEPLTFDAEDAEADAETAADADAGELADGEYTVEFDTDSTMFHANEATDGKVTLTVKDGEMTVHVPLVSKSIVNLYYGTAEDAQKEGAELLEPTVDTVTYSDGTTDEVYAFDIPVPALNEEYDVAIIGEKGTWYDHKVSVSGPLDESADASDEAEADVSSIGLEDGVYMIDVSMEGGTGKATIASPTELTVMAGEAVATIEWSSPNYDYMVVDGETYLPVNTDGNSVFVIPVTVLDEPMTVIGDTTAMSEPHEVEYTLVFDSSSVEEE